VPPESLFSGLHVCTRVLCSRGAPTGKIVCGTAPLKAIARGAGMRDRQRPLASTSQQVWCASPRATAPRDISPYAASTANTHARARRHATVREAGMAGLSHPAWATPHQRIVDIGNGIVDIAWQPECHWDCGKFRRPPQLVSAGASTGPMTAVLLEPTGSDTNQVCIARPTGKSGMSSTPVAMSCVGPRHTGTSLRRARTASRTNMSASHWVLHPGTRVPRVMIDARSGASRAPIWFAMGGRAWPPAMVGDHWSQASARFWAGTWHGWRVDLGPWAELHACP
jgi:hypothetical protein